MDLCRSLISEGCIQLVYLKFKQIDTVLISINLQVTGVVGRAETLSSVFFLAAFMLYAKASRNKKYTGNLFFFRRFVSGFTVEIIHKELDRKDARKVLFNGTSTIKLCPDGSWI